MNRQSQRSQCLTTTHFKSKKIYDTQKSKRKNCFCWRKHHPANRRKAIPNIFHVLAHTDDGDVIFSGVDLEKSFRAGHFAVGDVVFIEKTIAEFFNEFGGKREVRVRNEYKVTVIKKA